MVTLSTEHGGLPLALPNMKAFSIGRSMHNVGDRYYLAKKLLGYYLNSLTTSTLILVKLCTLHNMGDRYYLAKKVLGYYSNSLTPSTLILKCTHWVQSG